MQSLFIPTGLVALAEIGDKTQLLSLMLAARFRKPLPILCGILGATLANHAFAGAIGSWISGRMGAGALSWILLFSFLSMAIWILIPDKAGGPEGNATRFGVFGATLIAFFLAEMGDKTQVATIALAAKYRSIIAVTIGTTIGMMLANAPVVFLGDRFSNRMPLKPIRYLASGTFFLLGGWTLLEILR